MSVADLMITFMQQYSFSKINEWNNRTFGYCFHSDHTLGIFFEFPLYHNERFTTIPIVIIGWSGDGNSEHISFYGAPTAKQSNHIHRSLQCGMWKDWISLVSIQSTTRQTTTTSHMSQDTTRGYETTVYGVESNDDEIFFRKNAMFNANNNDIHRQEQRRYCIHVGLCFCYSKTS